MQTKEEKREYKKKWRENNKDKIKIYQKEYAKKRYQNHKEEIIEQHKEYRKNNREEISRKGKEYYQKNKEEINKQQKEYRENHREEAKEYYQNNKEEILEQKKEYYKNNEEEKKVYQKEYSKNNKEKRNKHENNRKKTDINYKLTCNLRSRLTRVIKNNQKSGSAVRDLGCGISELILYLESKFQPGMTWDNWNYRGWHIDHIIPLSSFNLTIREELLKAVHFTNLQPLWWYDNISKGNRIINNYGII